MSEPPPIGNDRDIILWKRGPMSGRWQFRDDIDSTWLVSAFAEDFEIIHYESKRWHLIQEV